METNETMSVHVKLFSRFREHLPDGTQGEATLQLPPGATVDHLLARVSIDRRVRLIVINDEPEADRERVLHDGDTVKVFPVVVGG